jgi:hypothetical protein
MRCGRCSSILTRMRIRRCCEGMGELWFPPFRKVRERIGQAPFFVLMLRKFNPLSPFSMLFIKLE